MDTTEPRNRLTARLYGQAFKPDDYVTDISYQEALCVEDIHTTKDLFRFAETGAVQISAEILHIQDGRLVPVRYDTKSLLEAHRAGHGKDLSRLKFRESVDYFGTNTAPQFGGLIGNETIPMIGGPFYKQLYYQDYIKAHGACFYAWNHDPFGKATARMTRDFTLGRGFRVDIKDDPGALALWRAFEDVNNLQEFMQSFAIELSIYGEDLIWFLPNQQTQIVFNPAPNQKIPRALIPRIKLVDPSNIWEIITPPESIDTPIAYQWVAPTQYQTYSAKMPDGTQTPGSKFIFKQIPADQMIHIKCNSVSNEKRGRGDYFAALGFGKRLRDSINYGIIALQKASAWAIDTTIEGDDIDLASYVADQQALGTIAPAGSEFVHTAKVTRNYAGFTGGAKAANSQVFEWTLSGICSSTGFPVSYYATHLSGGQTRGSAIVATEPIAKQLEMRQVIYEQTLKKIAAKFFQVIGYNRPVEIEVTFPEIITQDRTAKLKDLALAETQGWLSRKRVAEIAAKELGVTEFDYAAEQEAIQGEQPLQDMSILSATGALSPPQTPSPSPSALPGTERKEIKQNAAS